MGVSLAITGSSGSIELLAIPDSRGKQEPGLPAFDSSTDRMVWAHPSDRETVEYGRASIFSGERQPSTLWAAGPPETKSDLATIVALFQDQLAVIRKHHAEIEGMAAQLLETYEEINLFYELADAFEVAEDEIQIDEILLARALDATSGQGGAVVTMEGDLPFVASRRGELGEPFSARDLRLLPALEAAVTRSVSSNLSPGGGGEPATSLDRHTIIAPLPIKGVQNGALVIQKRTGPPFTAGEMKIAQSLSTQAGIFQSNMRQAQRLIEAARLTEQIELAETIQRQLLPDADPKVQGLDIAALYLASNQVGGDYYDIFQLAPNRVAALIADVSGHSVASGLIMTSARAAIRLLAKQEPEPATVLEQLNNELYHDLEQTGSFFSMFLMVLDIEARTIDYASAGHNPPLAYRGDGEDVISLDPTGPLIGITPDIHFDQRQLPIKPSDALVLYTDGVIEARDAQGEFLGEDYLTKGRIRSTGLRLLAGLIVLSAELATGPVYLFRARSGHRELAPSRRNHLERWPRPL